MQLATTGNCLLRWQSKLSSWQRVLLVAILLSSSVWTVHALLRFYTFHNHTFDLAMYARMAWGYAHLNFWDPIVLAWYPGVHLSPVMWPLGILGMVFGTVPVLLVVQSLCIALAAWPLARMAERRFGGTAALLVGLAWLLHPNLGQVATYEFHPGTLAVLPMMWAMHAIDCDDARTFKYAVIAVLCCREDFALITALMAVLTWHRPELHALGIKVMKYSLLYALVFALLLLPLFGPKHGSLEAHFGAWGSSLPTVAWYLLRHPVELFAHLSEPQRLFYLPKIFATLAFLPLLAPKVLLLLVPTLAINLLSQWPGTTDIGSHYLTAALPFLFCAAVMGTERLVRNAPQSAKTTWDRHNNAVIGLWLGVLLVVGAFQYMSGGVYWSRNFIATDFRDDSHARYARQALVKIPADVSVQAPDALLPHLAERADVHRGPPPYMNGKFIIKDIAYRRQYPNDGTVLRTKEDPLLRVLLSHPKYAAIHLNSQFIVFERDRDPRQGPFAKYIRARGTPVQGKALSSCLNIAHAELQGLQLNLRFWANAPCPADLGLRIGTSYRPQRIDLLFDGIFSPAHLRQGDVALSTHTLTTQERSEILGKHLRIGLVRSSGARPHPKDPDAINVELQGVAEGNSQK